MKERDHYEEVEEMCRRFRKDTGLTCPGKDVAAAAYSCSYEERFAAWKEWLKTQEWVIIYKQ